MDFLEGFDKFLQLNRLAFEMINLELYDSNQKPMSALAEDLLFAQISRVIASVLAFTFIINVYIQSGGLQKQVNIQIRKKHIKIRGLDPVNGSDVLFIAQICKQIDAVLTSPHTFEIIDMLPYERLPFKPAQELKNLQISNQSYYVNIYTIQELEQQLAAVSQQKSVKKVMLKIFAASTSKSPTIEITIAYKRSLSFRVNKTAKDQGTAKISSLQSDLANWHTVLRTALNSLQPQNIGLLFDCYQFFSQLDLIQLQQLVAEILPRLIDLKIYLRNNVVNYAFNIDDVR